MNKFGSISILVLVFGLMFTVTIGGLVSVAAIQQNNNLRTEVFEQSLTIAQAGAEYYRWHLAHDTQDFTDGTGQPGPYTHTLTDPYGNTDGTYQLTISPPASGSSIITVSSTGWLNNHPEIKRTVVAKYGIPSFAKFAFLQNANVWYGQKSTVYGKVFSNGGIRMDGTNTSLVQSSKATYTCGTETGCSTPTTKPGVWGDGGPSSLWEYPVTAIDFNSVSLNLSLMKTAAQQMGVYLGSSGAFGYHVVFNSDGSYVVTKVTNASTVKGWSVENGCQSLSQNITAQTPVGTYTIAEKPLFFAEDTVWVEGVVNGRATVVAAKFPLNVNSKNIWIPNNITYLAKDGNSSLGLIAQNNIMFALAVPQDFEIDAAMFAQNGNVIRHNYKVQGCGHYPQAVRQNLTIYGAVISNLKSYWNFGQGSAGFGSDPASGFSQRVIIYDSMLYFTPPPYFPSQGSYDLISWSEK